MVFGGWALFTGVSHILAPRRANVEDTDRGLMTTMGGAVAVVGLVLLIWPGTGVVAISWIIALVAQLFAALLIFTGATPQAAQEAGRQTRAATIGGVGPREPVSGGGLLPHPFSSSEHGPYCSVRRWDEARSSLRSPLPLTGAG